MRSPAGFSSQLQTQTCPPTGSENGNVYSILDGEPSGHTPFVADTPALQLEQVEYCSQVKNSLSIAADCDHT
jgi:hypothetical protein